ncbi:MAG: hypothetical protein Q4C64_06915 [Erysipelotrichia bacterium]|nr:hypothetical protein [Erysipelotrichia bacterium]
MKKIYLCLISYSFSIIALSEAINNHSSISCLLYGMAYIVLRSYKFNFNKKSLLLGLTIALGSIVISILTEIGINPLCIISHIFYNLLLINILKTLKFKNYLHCLKIILTGLIILFTLLLAITVMGWALLKTELRILPYALICILINIPIFLSYLQCTNSIWQKSLN